MWINYVLVAVSTLSVRRQLYLVRSTNVTESWQSSRPWDAHPATLTNVEGKGSQNNFGDFVRIQIMSSKSQVLIQANGETAFNVSAKTYVEAMEKAGLYIAVINPYKGNILKSVHFRTTNFPDALGIPPFLTSITEGHIIAFAIMADASLNLSTTVRLLLSHLGANYMSLMGYRSYMAWVVTKGGPTWVECGINEVVYFDEVWFTPPVAAEVVIPLASEDGCWNMSTGRERDRAQFCNKYGGYGSLCLCGDPSPIDFAPQKLDKSVIDEVPVTIVAKNRPNALYRCFLNLVQSPGGRVDRLLASLDGFDQETVAFLTLMKIKYVINDMSGRSFPRGMGTRIAAHYKFTLNQTFSLFPETDKIIVLEEDVLVAPDFFSYFNQTAWLLDVDPTLFCVSAWNDLGALHTSRNPFEVYRVETHAGYGWMMHKKFFNEVFPIWKEDANHEWDWDIWFRGSDIRGGRECVVPFVSRTFHFSVFGAHIGSTLTHAHFSGHAVTKESNIRLTNVERMTFNEYEEDLFAVLEGDHLYFLNTSLHPCNSSFLPRDFTKGPVVLFFEMDNNEHRTGWQKIGGCLGLWDLDVRSHHRGLIHFYFYETEVYAIGYPYSDYSYLKPPWIPVIEFISESKESEAVSNLALYNRLRFPVPQLEKYYPFMIKQMATPQPVFSFA